MRVRVRRLASLFLLAASAGCAPMPFGGRVRPAPPLEPALEVLRPLPNKPVHVAWAAAHETAEIARTDEFVVFGVPLARGRLRAVRGLETAGADGKKLPSVLRATSRWSDGSIRWLEVETLVSVPARGSARLEIRLAPKPAGLHPHLPAQPAPPPAEFRRRVRVRRDPETGRIRVDAGAVRFEMNPTAGRLLDRLSADLDGDGRLEREEEAVASPGLDLFVERAPRSAAGGKAAPERLSVLGRGGAAELRAEVEESGPLRAVIRVTGWHAAAAKAESAPEGASPERSTPFVLRVYAHRDRPWIVVQHTFIVSDSPYEWTLSAAGLRVPVRRPPGGAEAPPVADEALVQENATPPRYPDFAGFTPRYRLLSGGAPVEEGQALNWLSLAPGGAGAGVCLAVRGMARAAPMRLAIDGKSGAIEAHLLTREAWEELLPPDARGEKGAHGWLEFTRTEGHARYGAPDAVPSPPPVDRTAVGAARTHEILLLFHDGKKSDERLAGAAAAFSEPLVVLPDPEELARSRVLGHLPVPGAAAPRLARGAARLAEWARLHAEDWFGWHGAWDEGGLQSVYGEMDGLDIGARWWNWHGRHGWAQDAGAPREGLLLQALRTGDARLWRLAARTVRHSFDVDTVHWAREGEKGLVGFSHRPGATHWSGSARRACEATHPGMWLLYARASGDRRALDAVRLARAAFEGCTLDDVRPHDYAGAISPAEAAHVRALAAFHADAPDGKLRARLEALVGELAARLRRGAPEEAVWYPELLPALEAYYRASGSEAAAELLVRATRRLQRARAYGYAAPTRAPGARAAAYAWRLTGDRLLLERALAAEKGEAAWRAGAPGATVTRDLAREIRALADLAQVPYLAQALREAGIEIEPEGKAGREGAP